MKLVIAGPKGEDVRQTPAQNLTELKTPNPNLHKLPRPPGCGHTIITMEDITAEELKSRIEKGEKPFIIDVREQHEYAEDNIGGVLIPLGTLPHNIDDLEEYKDQEVIVQCRSGARSATAKAILEQHGFQKVRNLLGGILAYRG